MRLVKVAVIQMACSEDHAENVDKAENLVREAAVQGANIILLPELFETRYFCKQQNPEFFEWARPFEYQPVLERMGSVAEELNVVLPVSFFERSGNNFSTRWPLLTRMARNWEFTGNLIFQMVQVTRKSFIFLQGTADLKFGILDLEKLVQEFAGINGFRKQLV